MNKTLSKRINLALTLLLSGFFVQAQNYDDYKVRESKGALPSDFTIKSSTKYRTAVAQIGKKEKRKDVRLKKQFFLESNFSIDQMLRNGSVLYDPDFSDYLRSVAAQVLGKDKEMVAKTHFYVVRSPAVNAFATNEGVVFVCMGLLAQLENEAQLGFVLSHEIIHVREKHAVNMYVKVDDLKKGINSDKIMRRNDFEDRMLQQSKYSKNLELEADTKGFNDYYSKSGYSIEAIDNAYDVMRFADSPFDEQVFDKTLFEDANYILPERLFLKTTKKVEGTDEKEDDEHATHPNIDTRRTNMAELIAAKKAKGGKEYIISEALFRKWQKISRFELPQQYLHHNAFQEAVYASFLLLKDDPNSIYLKKSMAKALYSFAKFRNSEDDEAEAESADFEKQEGESQQVYHLFEKMDKEEITVLATNYAWHLYQKNPKDKELEWLAKDIVADLVTYHENAFKNYPKDFKAKEAKVKAIEEAKKEAEKEAEKAAKDSTTTQPNKKKTKTKYDKIKAANTANPAVKGDSSSTAKAYLQFALTPFFADTAFAKAIEKGKIAKKNIEDYKDNNEEAKFQKQRARDRKQGVRLGIDKIVIVNPYYMSVDARKKNAIQYIETEENATRFRAALLENAKRVGVDVEILSPNDFTEKDTEKYNDMTVLNEWVNEQIDFGSMDFQGYRAARLDEIAKKYKTRYFGWTGVVSLREKKDPIKMAAGITLSVFTILPIPFFIYWAVKPDYETLLYTVIYDTETRSSRLLKYEYMKQDDKKYILDMHLYDAFLQIKSK